MPCQCGEHNTRRLCEAFRNPQTEQEAVLNKMWVQSTNALQQNRWNNLQTLDGALKQTGEKFRQQLDDMVKELGETGTDTANGMLRLQSLVADIKDMCKDAGLTVSSQTESMLTSIYDESQKRVAWMLDGATPGNVSINFDLVPKDQIMSMLGQNFEGGMFSKRIFEISDKMATDIQTSLTQGMLTGSSIKDMADKVYDIFGDEHSGYYYRATLIARTETIRAREMARDRMFKANKDIIEGELWVGMESECDQCAEVEAEHNEGGNSDLQPVIDTHPNCVCTKMAVLKPWNELADGSGEQPEEPEDFEDFTSQLANGTLPRMQEEEEPLHVDYKLEYDTKTGKMKRVGL